MTKLIIHINYEMILKHFCDKWHHRLCRKINQTNTCAITFIAALITIAKSWTQSKFPSMNKCINKCNLPLKTPVNKTIWVCCETIHLEECKSVVWTRLQGITKRTMPFTFSPELWVMITLSIYSWHRFPPINYINTCGRLAGGSPNLDCISQLVSHRSVLWQGFLPMG